MGLSNATPTWVACSSGSSSRKMRDHTTPIVAFTSCPTFDRRSGLFEKYARKSSYVPSTRWSFIAVGRFRGSVRPRHETGIGRPQDEPPEDDPVPRKGREVVPGHVADEPADA